MDAWYDLDLIATHVCLKLHVSTEHFGKINTASNKYLLCLTPPK